MAEEIKQKSDGTAFAFADAMSLEEYMIAENKNYVVNDTLELKKNIFPKFKIIEDFLEEGYIARYKGMELVQSYIDGNVMFYPYADWHAASIKANDVNGEDKWGLLEPIDNVFYRGGYGYAILKSSKNKEAAAKRVGFILTEDGAKTIFAMNQMPAYKDAGKVITGEVDSYFNIDLNSKFYSWYLDITNKLEFKPYDNVIEKTLRMKSYDMMESGLKAKEAIHEAELELEPVLSKYGVNSP